MKDSEASLEKKLNLAIGLLQHLLALELAREGVPQQDIAKHLRLAKASVGKMLTGVKRRGQQQ